LFSLKIAQISTLDNVGGAAKVAWNLHNAYKQQGCESWMLVGRKTTNDPNVIQIPNDTFHNTWTRLWAYAGCLYSPFVGKIRGAGRLKSVFTNMIGQPKRWLEHKLGIEDFNFPGSSHALEFLPQRPDILQCHNLHGGYFDLRALPRLSRQVPVVLTLHDAWMLSGHCAHSFDCERWKSGCGQCNDLSIYPAICRDATAYNWKRKQKIYARSRVYVVSPSQWLMDKVDKSILKAAIIKSKVIPNGVDLSIFHPIEKKKAREEIGLPLDANVLLFAANGIRNSIWRDFQTMRKAVIMVAEQLQNQSILFVALGEEAPPEQIGQAEVRFIPHQPSLIVARYYQAADLYLHGAKADTFPNVVIEALACGAPVVATAVGGIPEQIKGLKIADCGSRVADLNRYGIDEATGVLVLPGDAEGMAEGIVALLTDDALRSQLGENAAHDARERFDPNRQVGEYLSWYYQILSSHKAVNR
jgi:glycosyltransferase involved in cell wall biosynthesis